MTNKAWICPHGISHKADNYCQTCLREAMRGEGENVKFDVKRARELVRCFEQDRLKAELLITMQDACDRIESLERIAEAALRYKLFQDEWGNKGQHVAGHYEAWLACQDALRAAGYLGDET